MSVITTCIGTLLLLISGCLYRGDGAFKKIGNSDYKAQIKVLNLFVAADGHPTLVQGSILREDRISPLKFTRVILKKKEDKSIVATEQTNHIGIFHMSAVLYQDDYIIEIDSPQYTGNKVITVEPGKKNWHELVAQKR
jgi:hypothetical protein